MRRAVITDSAKRQIGELAAGVERVTKDSSNHRDAINDILVERFGADYTGNRDAIEFFDKHANDVGTAAMAALMLNMAAPQLSNPDMADIAVEALNAIGRWTTGTADKPRTPAESRAMAINRAIGQLEAFIAGHTGDFNRPDMQAELQDHVRGLRDDIRELIGYADTARRLSQTISPTGANLASSA